MAKSTTCSQRFRAARWTLQHFGDLTVFWKFRPFDARPKAARGRRRQRRPRKRLQEPMFQAPGPPGSDSGNGSRRNESPDGLGGPETAKNHKNGQKYHMQSEISRRPMDFATFRRSEVFFWKFRAFGALHFGRFWRSEVFWKFWAFGARPGAARGPRRQRRPRKRHQKPMFQAPGPPEQRQRGR